MGTWTADSKTHVAHMDGGDFFSSESPPPSAAASRAAAGSSFATPRARRPFAGQPDFHDGEVVDAAK